MSLKSNNGTGYCMSPKDAFDRLPTVGSYIDADKCCPMKDMEVVVIPGTGEDVGRLLVRTVPEGGTSDA